MRSGCLSWGAKCSWDFSSKPLFRKSSKCFSNMRKHICAVALLLMILALALFLTPSTYQLQFRSQYAENEFLRRIGRAMHYGLAFALALGLDGFIAAERVTGFAWGTAAGIITLGVALSFWY